MEILSKNTNKKVIYTIVSVVLLCVIFFQIYFNSSKIDEVEKAWETLKSASPILIFIAIICAPLSWLIESKKWQYMANKFTFISTGKSLASVMTGMSFAFISPGKLGDFAGRMLYFESKDRWRAIVSVIISNMAHLMVTLMMGFVGSIVLLYKEKLWWQWIILSISALLLIVFGWIYTHLHNINFTFLKRKPQLRKLTIALYLVKKYNKKDLLIIMVFSLIKFCVYTIQYLLIAYLLGADIPVFYSFFVASVMFWMITIIPSFFIADIVVRGYVANLLFITSGITISVVPILSASYILWVVNWVLPSLLGAFILMIFKNAQKNRNS